MPILGGGGLIAIIVAVLTKPPTPTKSPADPNQARVSAKELKDTAPASSVVPPKPNESSAGERRPPQNTPHRSSPFYASSEGTPFAEDEMIVERNEIVTFHWNMSNSDMDIHELQLSCRSSPYPYKVEIKGKTSLRFSKDTKCSINEGESSKTGDIEVWSQLSSIDVIVK